MSNNNLNTHHFFSLSDEIMVIIDLYGKVKKVNPAFEKILGYTSDQLEGKLLYSFIHPDDLKTTEQKFNKVLQTNEGINLEIRFRCKDNNYQWLHWYNLQILDGCVLGIAKNIDKQKKQNHLLQIFTAQWQSQSGLLDTILNTIPEYICLLNDKREFIYLNKTAALRMGIQQEKVIGKTIDDINLFISGMDQYKQEVNEVLSSGSMIHKTSILTHNGAIKEIEYFVLPVDLDGAILGVIYIARDITSSNKARRNFEASQKKLKKIIDLVPYPIFLKDGNQRYTLCNQAQADLFYTTFENILGKTDQDFIKAEKELEEIMSSDLKILQEQVSVVLPEQILTDEKGLKKILHTTKIPFYNEIDNTINILGISIDITSIKKSEEELLRTNFELDSFVYKSSHDLRAPLRSLIGLLNLARKEKDPVMLHEILDRSNKSIAKLDTFIADLTNFSRNSRLDIVIEKINFDQVIKDCIENLKFMDNAANVKMNVLLQVEKDFHSDPSRIPILFMNLVSNAIKYNDAENKNPYVNITVTTSSMGAEIIVEDNGIGIDKEFHDKIFGMFFRASEKAFGSGLGLYIVKQVVDKLSGKIELQSTIGEGSLFKIVLPTHKSNTLFPK